MIPVESVTRSICDLALSFGEGVPQGEGSGKSGSHSMSRPFGVAMLIAGCDHRGPQLYVLKHFLDPTSPVPFC